MEISTPSHVYLTTGLSAVTPGGDSNVLKKVASFTVGERLNATDAAGPAGAVSASASVPLIANGSALTACCSTTMLAARVQRPTYVPEKLNFSAYQRFEGEDFML